MHKSETKHFTLGQMKYFVRKEIIFLYYKLPLKLIIWRVLRRNKWELNMQVGCYWAGKKDLFLYATLVRFLLVINTKFISGTNAW